MFITYLSKTVRLQNKVSVEQNINYNWDIIVDGTILASCGTYDACQLKYKQILESIKNGDGYCDIS